jgi:uncharacterized protein YkwD
MKRLWILLPLLFLTLILLPSKQAVAHPIHFSPNFTAEEMISEVNNLRTAKKLSPYKPNSILMAIAQSHADYIASAGVMTHFDANGTPPFQRAIKTGYFVAGDLSQGGLFFENIGSGAGLTVSSVISVWQDNVKDLQTMISPDAKDVGAGVTVVNGMTYYVLDVGASTTDSATPPISATNTPKSGTQSVVVVISTPLEDGTVYHIYKRKRRCGALRLTTIQLLRTSSF